MKVYYRINDENISNEFSSIPDRMQKLVLEKWKYKTMWNLRSIEKEINEEGGIIIVATSGVKTRSFSPELTAKIIELVKNSKD